MASVLLVAAEEPRRHLLAGLLRRAGHDVTTAAVADEALRLVADAEPDAVVADIQPGSDGAFRLLYSLREHDQQAVARVPFVISAGRDRTVDRVRAWEAGCDAWVGRPHHVDELLGELDTVLGLDAKARAARRKEHFEAERRAAAERHRH